MWDFTACAGSAAAWPVLSIPSTLVGALGMAGVTSGAAGELRKRRPDLFAHHRADRRPNREKYRDKRTSASQDGSIALGVVLEPEQDGVHHRPRNDGADEPPCMMSDHQDRSQADSDQGGAQ